MQNWGGVMYIGGWCSVAEQMPTYIDPQATQRLWFAHKNAPSTTQLHTSCLNTSTSTCVQHVAIQVSYYMYMYIHVASLYIVTRTTDVDVDVLDLWRGAVKLLQIQPNDITTIVRGRKHVELSKNDRQSNHTSHTRKLYIYMYTCTLRVLGYSLKI